VGIIQLLVICALVGLIAWALVTYVPMPGPIKTIIVFVAVIFLVLLLLSVVFPGFHDVRIPSR